MKPISERNTVGEVLELTDPHGPINFEEAKRNYRRLIKQYHPDVNKSPEALEYTKKLNVAWNLVTGKIQPPPPTPPPPPSQPVRVVIQVNYGGFYYTGSSGGTSSGWW